MISVQLYCDICCESFESPLTELRSDMECPCCQKVSPATVNDTPTEALSQEEEREILNERYRIAFALNHGSWPGKTAAPQKPD